MNCFKDVEVNQSSQSQPIVISEESIRRLGREIANHQKHLFKENGFLDIESFISDLASKLAEKLKGDDDNNTDDSDDDESDAIWQDLGDNKQQCIPCKLYVNSAPIDLKKHNKGLIGHFILPDSTYSKSQKKERRKNIRNHKKNPLHKWCLEEQKRLKISRKEFEKQNVESGNKLVNNAVHCLLNGGSAKAYVKLNSKEQMSDDTFPTKNDGAETFFEIREIVFEELSEVIKDYLRTVKHASYTLDKVTYQPTFFMMEN